MIRLKRISPQLIEMNVQMNIEYDVIFAFLQHRGYKIKPWLYRYTEETFPGGITYHEVHTWTATRDVEPQSEESLFLTVLESELKALLKELK